MATTHIAKIKMLGQENPDMFINTCVEFDEITLKPTYKLIWGEAGLSNAICKLQIYFVAKIEKFIVQRLLVKL